MIEAFNKATLVNRPACYSWMHSGVWFGCGFIYTDKRHGELFGIKYSQGNNYILQCLEGQITVSRYNTTVV